MSTSSKYRRLDLSRKIGNSERFEASRAIDRTIKASGSTVDQPDRASKFVIALPEDLEPVDRLPLTE